MFVVRLDPSGEPRLDGVERALVRSRAKLAYDRVADDDLPVDLPEFARRMAAADERRGAGRLEAPEQEVEHDEGGYRISFRPRLASEDHNAALSLATNLAVARALHDAGTGLFRVMDEPDARQVKRLRHTARAMGIDWPKGLDLVAFERTLRGDDARHAAMIMAVRRAGGGARYVPYEAGVVPWHDGDGRHVRPRDGAVATAGRSSRGARLARGREREARCPTRCGRRSPSCRR